MQILSLHNVKKLQIVGSTVLHFLHPPMPPPIELAIRPLFKGWEVERSKVESMMKINLLVGTNMSIFHILVSLKSTLHSSFQLPIGLSNVKISLMMMMSCKALIWFGV